MTWGSQQLDGQGLRLRPVRHIRERNVVRMEYQIDIAKGLAATIPPPRDMAPRYVDKLTVMWVADVDRRVVATAAAAAALRYVAAGQFRNNLLAIL